MKYLSLFSGVEAVSVAWERLGWECVAVSEIEPFPCEVLAHHYPHVPNLGDVTKVTEQQIKALGRIDIVVFGSPCQDLSVAGKRAGLKGERSGLFSTAMQIIKWSGARFAIWENVPGAFSSNAGADFATVVSEMAGLRDVRVPPNGWGKEGAAVGDEGLLEWGVIDAQYDGVAQRRRRVFAIRDSGDWAGRPPILLERKSLRGDTPPSREARQGAALNAGGRREEVLYCIDSQQPPARWAQEVAHCLAASMYKEPQSIMYQEIAGALCARDYKGVGSQYVDEGKVIVNPTPRRLTPRECERLQGFPDDYTKIAYRGKSADDCPDGPRYKAMGNSMAVPVMYRIGRMIQEAVDYARA